jgi:membrane protein YqaA with SNARE-associated domain
MQEWIMRALAALIDWFELPQHGLSSVFLIALLSATLLPMGSEPAVFGYVKLNPDAFWLTVGIATLGNTFGGMVNYVLGRGAHHALGRKDPGRYLQWFSRFGPKVLFLSFLPVVGDPLCALAGWLRLPALACMLWMAFGKLVRYTTMTAMLLWVPAGWWKAMLGPLAPVFGL